MSRELAQAIIGIYRRHAAEWDRERGRSLFEKPWLDRFVACLPPGARVLDLGCGSGEPIGRYLVDQGLAVTGVDTSGHSIGLCRTRMPEQTWIEADMRTLALGEAFDGILAWDSFFHLAHDDQRRMFEVFARHAGDASALMFTSGPHHGEAIGEFAGEKLYHASLAPEEYRALFHRSGFDVVDFRADDPDCAGHTVWLARRRGAGAQGGRR